MRPCGCDAVVVVWLPSAAPSGMGDQRLHRGRLNETSLAKRLFEEIGEQVAIGDHGGIRSLDSPQQGLRSGVGRMRVSSPGIFVRARGHLPKEEAIGDMRNEPVIQLLVKYAAECPIGERG